MQCSRTSRARLLVFANILKSTVYTRVFSRIDVRSLVASESHMFDNVKN